MKLSILVSFILFGICGIEAQTHKGFQWIDVNHSLYKVDLSSGMVSIESTHNTKLLLGKIQNWDSLRKEMPGDFYVNFFKIKKDCFFTIPGTGHLYTFDLPILKLNRIDHTYFRGYNFNAAQFLRNDTIFSIGGNGFWQRHSIITFFNPKTKEWDMYTIKNQNINTTDNKFSGYSEFYDSFFSANLDVETLNGVNEINLSIYSFKNNRWECVGELKKDIIQYTQQKYRTVWTGKYLILFNDKSQAVIRIINPFTNELYKYEVSNDHFFLSNCELYYSNGYLFSRSEFGAGGTSKGFVDSISIESLLKNAIYIGNAYEPKRKKSFFRILAILVLIAILFTLSYRRFFIKQNELMLSELECKIVKVFLNSEKGTRFTTLELNELLQIQKKTYNNQRQIRNRFISLLNQKLGKFFDSMDFVCRTPNNDDKRMMDYFINLEIDDKDLESLIKLM